MQPGSPFAGPPRRPQSNSSSTVLWVILFGSPVLLCGGCLFLAMLGGGRSKAPAGPRYAIDCSRQAERKKLIDRFVDAGLAQKLTPGATQYRWELWVRPAFMRQDFDTKQRACNGLFAYCYCESNQVRWLMLVDASSGKEIGEFSPDGGLEIY